MNLLNFLNLFFTPLLGASFTCLSDEFDIPLFCFLYCSGLGVRVLFDLCCGHVCNMYEPTYYYCFYLLSLVLRCVSLRHTSKGQREYIKAITFI
jgi:hypothetical protein